MSTPGPVQPRRVSPAVYRRRRLVALLVLVAIITAIVLIITRPGSADPAPTPKPTVTKTAVATPTATAVAAPTPTPTPTVDVSDYKECNPKNLVVTAVTDAPDYQPGSNPDLSLTITNTSKTACYYNVGTSQQVFEIKSGAERYWISTDCQSESSDTNGILEPGVPASSGHITWDRTYSSPDTCGGERAAVPSGDASHHLYAKVGDVSSKETAQFILR